MNSEFSHFFNQIYIFCYSCDEYEEGMGSSKSVKEFEVDILFGDSCSSQDDCVVSDVNSRMQITGRMCARAFVYRWVKKLSND